MAERFKAIRTVKGKEWIRHGRISTKATMNRYGDRQFKRSQEVDVLITRPPCPSISNGVSQGFLNEVQHVVGEPCEIVTVELRVVEDENT